MATSQTTAPSEASRLQQLASEHSLLDSRLRQLQAKRPFSLDDEFEVTRLKKLKLHVKDAMRTMQT